MLLFIYGLRRDYENKITFQYITCYSLSWPVRISTLQRQVSIHHMLLFIKGHLSNVCKESGFNTSHVTLYPVTRTLFRWLMSFNTSHVTLYQAIMKKRVPFSRFQYITCYSLSNSSPTLKEVKQVSIHHMLLFIGGWHSHWPRLTSFQYITCYSLSSSRRRQKW